MSTCWNTQGQFQTSQVLESNWHCGSHCKFAKGHRGNHSRLVCVPLLCCLAQGSITTFQVQQLDGAAYLTSVKDSFCFQDGSRFRSVESYLEHLSLYKDLWGAIFQEIHPNSHICSGSDDPWGCHQKAGPKELPTKEKQSLLFTHTPLSSLSEGGGEVSALLHYSIYSERGASPTETITPQTVQRHRSQKGK